MHRDALPLTSAGDEAAGNRPTAKETIELFRKELEMLQKDISDVSTQARWWLTLWIGFVVYLASDGGRSTLVGFTALLAPPIFGPKTAENLIDLASWALSTLSGGALLAAPYALVQAAWPRPIGGLLLVSNQTESGYLDTIFARLKETTRQAHQQQLLTKIGLLLFLLAIGAGFLALTLRYAPPPGPEVLRANVLNLVPLVTIGGAALLLRWILKRRNLDE